jgi:hypothetical protein
MQGLHKRHAQFFEVFLAHLHSELHLLSAANERQLVLSV